MGKFQQGNKISKGRPKGSKNKIDKEKLIELVNLCVIDLNDNFENLNTYEKIKLIIAFKEVYRDGFKNITEYVEPRIFSIEY